MKPFNTIPKLYCTTICVVLLFIATIQVKAQVTPPLWDTAFGTCGGYYQTSNGIRAGSDGNIYTTFRYSGTINMGIAGYSVSPANGGGGTSVGTSKLTHSLHGVWATEGQSSGGYDYNMGAGIDASLNSYAGGIINSSAQGWFCTKTNVTGVLQWDIQSSTSGGYASGICTDVNGIVGAQGHTYICGVCNSGTMTVLAHSINAGSGASGGFVLRVNSQGQIDAKCWLIALAGPAGGASFANHCAMDYAGHLWVCGGYSGSPVFGSFTLPASGGSSQYNLYVVEIDTANGSVLTAYTAANAGSSSPWSSSATGLGDIVIDSCNNMYISGPYMRTGTWGSFTATCTGGGPNYYVAKLSPTGTFQWVETSSSPNAENTGYYLTIDKNWDITATGEFSNTATFGSETITGSSSGNVCVAKYASGNGALMYAEQGGGPTNGGINGGDITTDGNRQVYISGSYNTSPVFITHSGNLTLANGVSSSIYVAKLDSTPNLKIIPNPETTYCSGLCYTLPFTAIGAFTAGNVFTAQMSDATGSFAAGGTSIGTLTSTTSGIINICIPTTLPAGTNYLLRITSSKPNYCSIVRCNTITISTGPTVTLSGPINLCAGSSATLTALGGVSYLWSTGATTSSITVTPTADSTFTIAVGNGTCTKDTNIKIAVHPTPTVTVTGPGTLCSGGTGTLTATVGGGTAPYMYNWSIVGATSSSVTINPSSTQTYSVDVTDANGCSATGQVTVTIGGSSLAVTVAGTGSICAGTSTSICATATGGTGGNTFSWLPGSMATACITVMPGTTTVYTVSVKDNCGTKVSASIPVNVNPDPTVNFSVDVYQGCAPLCVQFMNNTTITSGAMQSFSWSFGNGDTLHRQTPIYCYPDAGNYNVSLTVTSDSGCSSTLNIVDMLTVYSHPNASFTCTPQSTSILSPDVQFTNTSTDAYTITNWSWRFGDSGDLASTSQNPAHTYADTGKFCATLVIMDVNGCTDTATNCMEITPAFTLYIPSVFTPNGDGRDEVFMAKGAYVKNFEMYIFDRWGMQLFYSNDINAGWDGTIKGGSKICQEDTYVYKITATDVQNTTHSYVGNVTLIK